MKSDYPTEDTIRQYLLGRLDDQDDTESRLSQKMLFDDELSEIVDSLEDEIIEDYLDDTLSPGDRTAMEQYFLRPLERQEKLRFARALRDHFETTGTVLVKKKLDASHESVSGTGQVNGLASSSYRIFQFRTWIELVAAVILIASGLVYVSGVRHRLQSQLDATRKTQAQIERELAQERERTADLRKQLQIQQPPVAVLTFLGPVFRDSASPPIVDIRSWTQQIRVDLDLRGAPQSDYDVRLETSTGRTVWSQSRVPASFGSLSFEIPAQNFSPGAYCLRINSKSEPFCFRARIVK